MKNKIALFSCFFGEQYNHFVPLWLQYNFPNFYPDDCDIFIFTDQYKENEQYNKLKNVNVIQYELPYKNRNDFLIYKSHWLHDIVQTYLYNNYEFCAFIQSNVFCNKVIHNYNCPFHKNKLIVCKHAVPESRIYSDSKNGFLRQESKFYLHPKLYPAYVHAGFFLSDTYLIKSILEKCIVMTDQDLKNNYFSPIQDESYFNRAIVDQLDNIIIKEYLLATNNLSGSHPALFRVLYKSKLLDLKKLELKDLKLEKKLTLHDLISKQFNKK